ncbi:hypothetical protein OSCT_0086 [Oscillochloris trichoides DG-6]|uniref:Response regulator receiver protein n=1 Tax=Oscillochloris trichoides DG-6 TaxID=765420 RepID=E1I9T5_9CHLR|nr:hypothetical protein OSCT_0086 [Oscillochloris trichoides DG-6]
MFDLQQHLRSIVGWDYDLLLTFSAKQALHYVAQRDVRLLITEATFIRHSDGSGAELARLVRDQAPETPVLLIHDEKHKPPTSPHIKYRLARHTPPDQACSLLRNILVPPDMASLSSSA